MAELNQPITTGHKKLAGVRKSKKLSTRVDLTPMVDLGFLLITFFIFTTSLSQPTALALKLPKDVPDDIKQKQPISGVLTLLLAGNDKVFYYEKDDFHTMQSTTFSGIRSVIIAKKVKTKASDFMVILKPSSEASYKNTIQILDEMNINAVKRYALVDIDPDEYNWIRSKK
jgi:biopolymer transport protein ExbD